MKISQLISGLIIPLSNQEQKFIDSHGYIKLNNLSENDLWLVQNLIRKGVYEISKDNNTLIKNTNETR